MVVDASCGRRSRPASSAGPLSPLPRGSLTTTRKNRARKGICAFHARLCTMMSGMSRYTVGRPVAVDLVVDRDPVAIDEAALHRLERAHQISSAEHRGGAGRAIRLHRSVPHVAPHLGDEGVRQRLRIGCLGIADAASGAVVLQAPAHVEVLLEVVLERHVEERPLRRGQLHAGREPALHDGDVARRQGEVEVGDESAHGRPASARQGCRVDARAGHDEELAAAGASAARAARHPSPDAAAHRRHPSRRRSRRRAGRPGR